LCGFGWSLTSKHSERLFENRVLRRIFGHKREERTVEWRKVQNEGLYNLYCSLNIVRVMESGRMRWAGHVADKICVYYTSLESLDSSVGGWATGWTIGVLGFDSRRGLGIFLFTTVYRTALGPTQPPVQWLPGDLSLGVKWPGREADHSPPSNAEVK
jgi:hypothetical protein